mmetsp:Transcript_23370/g.79501  ORF Transcript_23370/g.79501 Transcript_23370/m.79501 type:complete len:232 (-) Transcript_23370:901-1596(-)
MAATSAHVKGRGSGDGPQADRTAASAAPRSMTHEAWSSSSNHAHWFAAEQLASSPCDKAHKTDCSNTSPSGSPLGSTEPSSSWGETTHAPSGPTLASHATSVVSCIIFRHADLFVYKAVRADPTTMSSRLSTTSACTRPAVHPSPGNHAHCCGPPALHASSAVTALHSCSVASDVQRVSCVTTRSRLGGGGEIGGGAEGAGGAPGTAPLQPAASHATDIEYARETSHEPSS